MTLASDMLGYTPQVATMGRQVKIGVTAASASPSLPATTRLSASQCTLTKTPTHLDVPYFRGQLAHRSEDVVEGTYTVGGAVTLPFCRPGDLTAVLPLICGQAFTGNSVEPTVIATDFIASVDRGVKVFHYWGLRVAQAVFSSQAGQPLSLQMQLEGTEQTITAAGSFPSLDFTTVRPFIHHQGVMTVAGTKFLIANFQMTINNGLILDRFMNTQSRTEVPQGDRMVQVAFQTPFTTDEYATLYEILIAGVEASIVFTSSTHVFTIDFPCLQAPVTDPVPPNPQAEIPLQMNMTARSKSGSSVATEEFKFTLATA